MQTNERTGFIATQVYVVTRAVPNYDDCGESTRMVDSVWQQRKHADAYINEKRAKMNQDDLDDYEVHPVSSYQWAGE